MLDHATGILEFKRDIIKSLVNRVTIDERREVFLEGSDNYAAIMEMDIKSALQFWRAPVSIANSNLRAETNRPELIPIYQ
jgi:hypothetical protein